MYFDIHSHLNLEPLFGRRQTIIEKMKQEHVATITVGTGLETSGRAVEIAQETEWWATVGLHPIHVDDEDFFANEHEYEMLARNQRVVGIGECGFDYYRRDDNQKLQREVFRAHIELAQKVGKPLMIHARPHKGSMDAYHDVIDELMSYGDTRPYAHFHFFSGDKDTARLILDAGYSVSVDGPITFTSEYDDMIRFIPHDRIMCETDSPFAAPVPYRGRDAEPWMVSYVYERLGALWGVSQEACAEQIASTVGRIWNITRQ